MVMVSEALTAVHNLTLSIKVLTNACHIETPCNVSKTPGGTPECCSFFSTTTAESCHALSAEPLVAFIEQDSTAVAAYNADHCIAQKP